MMKRIVGLFALSLFPAIAMAGTTPSINVKPQMPAAHYVISQHGKIVYSGKVDLASAKAPEHFTVTVTKADKVVNWSVSGVTRPGDPMQISDVINTVYIAKANVHSVKNGTVTAGKSFTVTTGKTFTLIPLKQDNVQIIGSISRLVGIKTRKVHGETIQLPSVHESDINEMAHLARGQSTVFPMGGYQVKVARR
ncbi:hypothetical protein [Acidithiobacillus sp.]|uniref:hypothetical protein n=1 Tax=Acidithiobacillus sp. TaxID=1872118 RepID=UPI0025C37883|nr:hypothetical protein [Acidithiobacillus sp.]